MNDSKIIVTISGQDKIGIVATFTKVLADYQVNVEDIRQSIMQEQFVMFLVADIEKANAPFQEVKQALINKADEISMEVWVQRKAIIDNMHTI